MQHSPLKRALRNSFLIGLVVIGMLTFQERSTQEALLLGLFTFIATFPALWLSFNYTQKIADKYRHHDDNADQK